MKLKTSIISQYAADEIAIKFGPQILKNLYNALKNQENPCMNGWMLEMNFFASLKNGGLKIYDENNKEELFKESNHSNVFPIDPKNPKILDAPMWYKPSKWNQGGYDSIYIDKKLGLVKFIQVTQAKEHSFKIRFFSQLLNILKDDFEIKILEIYFIVTKEQF